MKNARELTRRAMDSAEYNDAKESAASYQAASALREVEIGNREEARAGANAALKLAPNREVRTMAALALARAGDTAEAEKLATELDKEFPLDTLVQRYWLPTIRGTIALEGTNPNRAVENLKETSVIELGGHNVFVSLVPVYVRGEAYLAWPTVAPQQQNFRNSLTIAGRWPTFLGAHWPAWDSPAPTPCKATPPKPEPITRIS